MYETFLAFCQRCMPQGHNDNTCKGTKKKMQDDLKEGGLRGKQVWVKQNKMDGGDVEQTKDDAILVIEDDMARKNVETQGEKKCLEMVSFSSSVKVDDGV